jgi:hypothetical protein
MAYPEINSKNAQKRIPEITWSLVKFYRLLTCSFFAAGAPMNIAIGAVMFGVMLAAANCT